jgi:uncharacterized protein YkwD
MYYCIATYQNQQSHLRGSMHTPSSNLYATTLTLLLILPFVFGEKNNRGAACHPAPSVQAPSRDFTQEVTEIIGSTNGERRKQHLAQLQRNEKLMRAAQAYAEVMNDRGRLSHRAGGQKLAERVAAAGYEWKYIGENVAINSSLKGVSVVIDQWMRSEGHRANILSGKFTEIGVGIAGPNKKNGVYYYCQVFGSPK